MPSIFAEDIMSRFVPFIVMVTGGDFAFLDLCLGSMIKILVFSRLRTILFLVAQLARTVAAVLRPVSISAKDLAFTTKVESSANM